MKIKLYDSTFIRNYGNYTYLFNSKNGKEALFKNQQYLFNILSKPSTNTEQIVDAIQKHYNIKQNINKDIIDFIIFLQQLNFLKTDSTVNSLYNQEKQSILNNESKINVRQYLREKVFIKKPTPVSIHIDITQKCNEQCLCCYLPTAQKRELDCKNIFYILDNFKQMGGCHVTFSGGECFLHPCINEILVYAAKLNLVIHIMSNLTYITDKHLETIEKVNPFIIQTTIFSIVPEIHDSITRSPGSLSKTLSNISKIKETNTKISINSPLLKHNSESMLKTWDFFSKNNLPFTPTFHIMKNFNKDNSTQTHRLSVDGFNYFIEQLFSTDRTKIKFLYESCTEQFNRQMVDCCCGAGIDVLAVGANGLFYPCSTLQQYPVGHINTPLSKVWIESPELERIRSIHYRSIKPCSQHCNQKCKICIGRNLSETGSLTNIGSYFCELNKVIQKYYNHN